MKLKNYQMSNLMDSLQPILDHKGILGYAAARNFRKLRDATVEFTQYKEQLFREYGTAEVDENGNPTGRYSIDVTNPAIVEPMKELDRYADIEHEVEIFTIPVSEVIDELTGNEMLALEFMLEEDRGQSGGDSA